MLIIKKIIASMILPPGVIIIFLAGLGGYLFFKGQRRVGVLSALVGIAIWVISTSVVSGMIMRDLESEYVIPTDYSGDVIILLGGGAYFESPDLSGIGSPSEGMSLRILMAARLQRRLNVPVIVSGGNPYDEKKAEAPITRRFLVDLGVSPEMVIVEDKSRDTIENARYSLGICRDRDFKRPVLVTSAYHMKRSVMSFEKVGMKVIPFPAGFRAMDQEYGWYNFLPDLGAIESSYLALRERVGLVFYRWSY